MSLRGREDEVKCAPELQAAEQKDAVSTNEAPDIGPGDFYYEGPYLVFTAAYHLRRGYCCNSDCRHCPYK